MPPTVAIGNKTQWSILLRYLIDRCHDLHIAPCPVQVVPQVRTISTIVAILMERKENIVMREFEMNLIDDVIKFLCGMFLLIVEDISCDAQGC